MYRPSLLNPYGDRTKKNRTCTPGPLPQGQIPPCHLPPGHLPPRHIPLRTYTPEDIYPQTLKCPIWFMHHVSITHCTLKAFILQEHHLSVMQVL